jgi:hypothetical protein
MARLVKPARGREDDLRKRISPLDDSEQRLLAASYARAGWSGAMVLVAPAGFFSRLLVGSMFRMPPTRPAA